VSEVLVLCTANVCRSPMAQALLTDRLERLAAQGSRSAPSVRSAGMLDDGEPPPREVIIAMAGYGLDVASHRSRRVSAEDLERADLTLAMAREHLRHAVVTAPSVWPRAFTLRELVRRGGATGRRAPGESLDRWLARVHDGRQRAALLGDSAGDDVADPIGGPQRAYTETAATLSRLVDELAGLCWPVGDDLPGHHQSGAPA
jgi:low molecular weight protein-tyrosine phosphatase